MFRDFKRHYHKVAEVYSGLKGKGSFSLEIELDGGVLQAKNAIPAEEETMRLVVLMRRFLNPFDSLYYRNAWKTLNGQFINDISEETIQHIDTFIEKPNKGYLGININGEDFTAERVYQIISNGEYFYLDEEVHDYLRSLASMPIVGPIFWHQFYEYTLTGFELISEIFDIILQVEKREGYNTLCGEQPTPINHCIYCMNTQKREPVLHLKNIFSQSLWGMMN